MKIIIDGYNVAHLFFHTLILKGDLRQARKKVLSLVKSNFPAGATIVWDNQRKERRTYQRGNIKIIFSPTPADNLISRLANGEKIIITADRKLATAVKKNGGKVRHPRKAFKTN